MFSTGGCFAGRSGFMRLFSRFLNSGVMCSYLPDSCFRVITKLKKNSWRIYQGALLPVILIRTSTFGLLKKEKILTESGLLNQVGPLHLLRFLRTQYGRVSLKMIYITVMQKPLSYFQRGYRIFHHHKPKQYIVYR